MQKIIFYKTSAIIFLTIFCVQMCCSQAWEENKANLITNLTHYRTALFDQDSVAISEFGQLIQRWESIETDTNRLAHFINFLHTAAFPKPIGVQKLIRKIKDKFPDRKLLEVLTKEDYKLFQKSNELIGLMATELLDYDYPYDLTKDESKFEELKFYNIKRGEKIADIGAGQGSLATILLLLDMDNQLYISEISAYFLEYLKKSFKGLSRYFSIDNVHIVRGKKKKVNLKVKVDKIIIRNTFHHFEHSAEMQQSIYNSLNDEGVVFITETIVILDENDKLQCKLHMTKEEINNSIDSALFNVVETKDIDNVYLLKLVKV